MNLKFKDGFVASTYCTADASDKWFVVQHIGFAYGGGSSKVITSENDRESLEREFTADLVDDDGFVKEVCSIWGRKPEFEILSAEEIGVCEVKESEEADIDTNTGPRGPRL